MKVQEILAEKYGERYSLDPTERHPLPWKQDDQLPRLVLDANDRAVVRFDFDQMAQFVVAAVNGKATPVASAPCQRIYTRDAFLDWMDEWGHLTGPSILAEMKRLKIKGRPAEPGCDIFAEWIRIVFGVKAMVFNYTIEIRNQSTGRMDIFDVPPTWRKLMVKFDSLALKRMVRGEFGRKGAPSGI